MKKFVGFVICFLLITLCAFALADVQISGANFPDDNFRNYVLTDLDNGDGVLTDEEISQITIINCSSKQIADLKGIECFTALKDLNCEDNLLSTLDMSNHPTLRSLRCDGNQLTTLNVSNCSALMWLYCGSNSLSTMGNGNLLTTLDVNNCSKLRELNCFGNQLTILDVSNCSALEYLNCAENIQLTTLNVGNCSALTELDCWYNELTTLDVSGCPALTKLMCDTNELTTLNVKNCSALKTLACNSNKLTTLDVSDCSALTDLSCTGNKLSTLDVSRCSALKDLSCTNNLLTTLDISKCPALRRLHCAENQLTTLHVSRCPILVDLVNNSTRNEYEGTNTSYWRNDSSYLQTDKYVIIDTWTIPSIDVIGSVSLSISAPAAESSSAVKPAIVVADGQNCMLAESNWYNADGTSDELSEDYIFEDGKSYKLWAILEPDEGYEFTEETTVNITGGKTEKVLYSYSFMIGLEISVDVPKAEKEDPTPIVPPSPDTPEEDAKKAADQEKADAVLATIKLLPSLSKLTVSDENKLNKAINAFMNLTDDQKALIPKDAVEALQKALEKMEILKAEDKDETSVRNIEKKITTAKNDSDLTNSVYGALMARTKAASGNSLTIMWNKLAKADGYIVYAGTCDHKGMEIVSTTKKNQLKLTKIGNRKLVKDTYYKVIVVAYQQVNGYDRAISISPVIHTATTAEKVTNPKSVTVKASKITLKKGKSVTIKATVTPASKKLELKNHRKLRYESSDSSIVSVNDKGKIKAKKKGTAYVFVYAQNGMSAKITVTVK